MKIRGWNSSRDPLDTVLEEESHPSAASTKQIKNAANKDSKPESPSIAEESRNQSERSAREDESYRSPADSQEKIKKVTKNKVENIKVAVGYRTRSERKSGKAFKKARPVTKSKVPSRGFLGGHRKRSTKTEKHDRKVKNSIQETLSLTENEDKVEEREGTLDSVNEEEPNVEQEKNDDASHHSSKSTRSVATASVSNQKEQGKNLVANIGSQMTRGRVSVDFNAWWDTLTEFPMHLCKQGEKDETDFPSFVASSVVDDVVGAIVELAPPEEDNGALLNSADVAAFVDYVSGNEKEHDEVEENEVEEDVEEETFEVALASNDVAEEDNFGSDAQSKV